MNLIKRSSAALLTAAALAISSVWAGVPLSMADTGVTVPSLRRAIDADVTGKELGVTGGSGYVYKDVIYGYLANSFTNAYAVGTPSYSGSALRIGYLNKNGDVLPDIMYTAILNTVASARCADFNTTALQLMYNPVYSRESSYVGITCRTKSGKAALMIRLNDYIELTGADYNRNGWIKITVPVNYFFEHGEFNPLGGTDTSFRRQSINGAVFGYSTEGLSVPQSASIAMAFVDDVRFVSLVREPQELKFYKNSASVTLSWNGLDVNTADKYRVYRDGIFVADVNGAASYTDTSVNATDNYIYSVCSVADDGEKSVSSHIRVDMASSDSGTFTETEKHILYSQTNRAETDDKLPVIMNWNRHCTATQYANTYMGKTLAYFAVGNSPLHQRQAAADVVTLPGTDRYRIMPVTTVTKTGQNVSIGSEPKQDASFSSELEEFEDYELVFEAAKGKGYTTSNIEGIRIGLAYVDYNTSTSYTTSAGTVQKVYATGIAWHDVTAQFNALAAYSDSNTWDSAKGTLSVNVGDILENGSKAYLHGAAEGTHKVSGQNANAVVFDIVTKTADYKSSSPVVLFDSVSLEKTTGAQIGNTGEMTFDIRLCDGNGREYNGTYAIDSYPDRVKLVTENTTGSAKTVKLVAAMYGSDNYEMKSVKLYDAAVPLGRGETIVYPGFYCGMPGNGRIKFFIVENCENIRPIAPSAVSDHTVESPEPVGTVTVLDDEYQTITGWGISPFLVSDKDFRSFSEYSDWQQMYDKVYGELGITSVRVPVDKECGYTDEPSDELKDKPIASELDYIVKYIQRAKDFGIDDWILCFWSPPAYMREKQYISDRGAELYVLKDSYRDIYCRYIVNVLDHLKNSGVGTPKALCFQNEPGGGTVNPMYLREPYVYVAKTLRALLNESGYTDVLIEGPESSSYHNCFRYTGGSYGNINFDYMRSDPEFADAIGVMSVHSYTSADLEDEDIGKFAAGCDLYPEKERWMTEVSGLGTVETKLASGENDYVMGPALFTMRVLSADVGWGGMNRWYYWRAYVSHYNADENGASYDVLNDKYAQQAILYGQTGGKVVKSKLYDCLKLLFNNVPVGSRVRRMTTDIPGIVNKSAIKTDLLAFETQSGTVVMITNIYDTGADIDVEGVTGGSAEIYSVAGGYDDIISSSADVENGSVQGVHIPPRSVTFVVSK